MSDLNVGTCALRHGMASGFPPRLWMLRVGSLAKKYPQPRPAPPASKNTLKFSLSAPRRNNLLLPSLIRYLRKSEGRAGPRGAQRVRGFASNSVNGGWRWKTCAITSLVELQYSCCFRQLFIKHKTFYCVFRAKRINTHSRGLPAAHYFGFVAILTWRENPQGKIRPQLADWFLASSTKLTSRFWLGGDADWMQIPSQPDTGLPRIPYLWVLCVGVCGCWAIKYE